MNQENLQKILLIISILGIFVLLLISYELKPREFSNQTNQPGDLTITGKITSITYHTNSISLKLENQNLEIILLENLLININKGDNVTIIGKLEQQSNQTTLLVNKIIKIN